MTPTARRVVQALLYELGAVAFTGPVLGASFDAPAGSALALAVLMSTVALAWNWLFNFLFERWESAQSVKGRSVLRRITHGTGFEAGLVLILVPLMAVWLDTSWRQALLAELGLLAFFLIYAVAFTWLFDRLFGLPASAMPR